MVDSYVSPMRSTAPAGSPSEYTDPRRIDALLKTSDPEAVAASGRSYQRFAEAYEKIAGALLSMRTDLHDAWKGEDAAAAQSQLRELWSAATTVHKTAQTFGVTIERHGSEHLAWYKYNKPPSKSLAEAQSWMTGANERVSQSWSSLPPDLSTTLPPGQDHLEHAPASDGPSRGADGPSKAAVRPGDGGPNSGHHLPGAELGGEGSDDGSGTRLAGAAPLTTAGGGTGLETGPGPLPGGTPPPGVPGIGPISPGGVLGETPRAGSAAAAARVPRGAPASPAGEARSVSAAAEAKAGGMGPAVGGGAAKEERERSRKTWLAEEEEIWTEGVEFAPELIEGASSVAEEETADASPIEIDLSADSDAISAILADLDVEGSNPPPEADVTTRISELRAQLAELERQRDAGLPATGDRTRDWLIGDDA
jgi:uncharacterized protein YukE